MRNITLPLKFNRKLLLVVVQQRGIWDDNEWNPHPHHIKNRTRSCITRLVPMNILHMKVELTRV
jgi:hypothetical protein